MREKSFVLICVLIISGFISSNLLCAEDIKIYKKVSEKSYKLQELKNNFLKTETKKIPVIAVNTESNGMSKGSAALLGGGIGLVVGAVIGGVLGNEMSSNSDVAASNVLYGVGIGGISGLVFGGLTGYIFGK